MASNDPTDNQRLHDHPAPGSVEARELGCSCSAKRNNHGLRPPFAVGTHIGGATGGWMMALDCALHTCSSYRGAWVG